MTLQEELADVTATLTGKREMRHRAIATIRASTLESSNLKFDIDQLTRHKMALESRIAREEIEKGVGG